MLAAKENVEDGKHGGGSDPLPPELLEKIFSSLDTLDVAACSQVNSSWRRFLSLNPFLLPKVVSKILKYLDHQTLLRSRLVCKLWKAGLDVLTERGGIVFRGQTSISSRRATQQILRSFPMFSNPFPSRTVKIFFILNERKLGNRNFHKTADETEVLRLHGTHIKVLNIKVLTCSRQTEAIVNVVRNVAEMLYYTVNVECLSIDMGLSRTTLQDGEVHSDDERNESSTVGLEYLEKNVQIRLMKRLEAFRIGGWNIASVETEWLYHKILRNSPGLKFFDPDYFNGYSKVQAIFQQPSDRTFNLTCLRLIVPGSKCYDAIELLHQVEPPLTGLHLDILEFKWKKNPKACTRVFQAVMRNFGRSLTTLALGFYEIPKQDKFLPTKTLFTEEHNHSPYISTTATEPRSLSAHLAKLSALLAHDDYSYNKIENLKLRGFKGSLDFLRNFKHLKRLLIYHYNPHSQSVFDCKDAFYRLIPSLQSVYLPTLYGYFEGKTLEWNLIDHKYLPLYNDICSGTSLTGLII